MAAGEMRTSTGSSAHAEQDETRPPDDQGVELMHGDEHAVVANAVARPSGPPGPLGIRV
jgi:hypothetical protein